jgi:hypothetical protein
MRKASFSAFSRKNRANEQKTGDGQRRPKLCRALPFIQQPGRRATLLLHEQKIELPVDEHNYEGQL